MLVRRCRDLERDIIKEKETNEKLVSSLKGKDLEIERVRSDACKYVPLSTPITTPSE